MEPLDDEQIQRALEEGRRIHQTVDTEAYQRLFQALQQAPSLQPRSSFSQRVVASVIQQQAQQKVHSWWVILVVGVLISLFMGLSAWSDPTIYSITLRSFALAKGWLLIGLGTLGVLLLLEHRFTSQTMVSRLDKHR